MGGLNLIESAASKKYGPALYYMGIRRIEGQDIPKDAEKGMEELRQAATHGSEKAQLYLGNEYEKPAGGSPDVEKARRYFRLCAVRGDSTCQYRLGNSLLNEPDRPERDYLQGIAWIQLAGEQGLQQAAEVSLKEVPKMTSAQITAMNAKGETDP